MPTHICMTHMYACMYVLLMYVYMYTSVYPRYTCIPMYVCMYVSKYACIREKWEMCQTKAKTHKGWGGEFQASGTAKNPTGKWAHHHYGHEHEGAKALKGGPGQHD